MTWSSWSPRSLESAARGALPYCIFFKLFLTPSGKYFTSQQTRWKQISARAAVVDITKVQRRLDSGQGSASVPLQGASQVYWLPTDKNASDRAVLTIAGLDELPIGKVYHMPGASDAYVTAFRSWLQRSAGGGPFGPQNEEWLKVGSLKRNEADTQEWLKKGTPSARSMWSGSGCVSRPSAVLLES